MRLIELIHSFPIVLRKMRIYHYKLVEDIFHANELFCYCCIVCGTSIFRGCAAKRNSLILSFLPDPYMK